MPSRPGPDLSLFVDTPCVHALEEIGAPYVIIGTFAGTVTGVNRTTYDIDIVVDLSDDHVQRLVARYPAPRYYADRATPVRFFWTRPKEAHLCALTP